ncbi:MAG: hypothetical protein R2878_06390 [Thermoleophilia bacterium]
MGSADDLIGTLVVLIVALIVARIVRDVLQRVLARAGIDRSHGRDADAARRRRPPRGLRPSWVIATVAYWSVLLTGVVLAVSRTAGS